MPAFMFEWVCNEYRNQELVKYFDAGVTITSFFVAIGAVDKGIKLLSYARIFAGAVDVALLNDSFEEYVNNIYINDEQVGEQILNTWRIIGAGLTLENPIEELLKLGSIEYFGALVTAWEGFKKTDKYKELLKSDEDMVKQMNGLFELIKNEEKE